VLSAQLPGVADETLPKGPVRAGQLRELGAVVVQGRLLAGLPATLQVDPHQLAEQRRTPLPLLGAEKGRDAWTRALLPGGIEPVGDRIDPFPEGCRGGPVRAVTVAGHE
jgi:hypothetical protein